TRCLSDWSSDVCSSDLAGGGSADPDDVAIVRCCILSTLTKRGLLLQNGLRTARARTAARPTGRSQPRQPAARRVCWAVESPSAQIGRASCRETVHSREG